MKLVENEAMLYDEFLFGPENNRVIRESREKFWSGIQRNPPDVMIVTSTLFPDGPANYTKLGNWPQFDSYLHREYSMYVQRTPKQPVRWWGRAEIPAGYRIYLRRTQMTAIEGRADFGSRSNSFEEYSTHSNL
jgi:hypothetical protein